MNADYDFQMNRGLLILFNLFDASPDEAIEPFQYCTGDEKLREIRERYQVEGVAESGSSSIQRRIHIF